ncbi:MAG TPA: right-handed parallel beta-helix repeat-containing protein [Pyrinomonadaceae bacterium]|nr:right-handed parallel beta-helix repeat-containing protein [Pyrinomonadaceae bacterium]
MLSEDTGAKQQPIPPTAAALPCTPTGITLPVPSTYPTIQAAINAANPAGGDKIQVAANTYTEQLSITKCVTIEGAGIGSTIIQAPATLAPSGVLGFTGNSIVEVRSNSYVTVTGVTITGPLPLLAYPNKTFGIFVAENATLDMSNSQVTAIHTSSGVDGAQNGTGIGVGSTAANTIGTIVLNNVTVNDYQKNGMLVERTGSVATIANSTVTGIGPTSIIAQNGIQIADGATGTITASTITQNLYIITNPLNPWASSGVLPWNAGAVTITGSTLNNNDVSVYTGTSSVPATPAPLTITGNTFDANTYNAVFYDAEHPVTITDNIVTNTNSAFGGLVFDGQTSTISRNSFTLAAGSGSAGLGFYNYDDLSPTTTATINAHFNRLSSDNAGGRDGIYNETSSNVNAENNWWGCNAGPGNTGCDVVNDTSAGTTNYSPWLTLTGITASAPTVQYNGTSNITGVSLCMNSVSADVCTLTDHIIDGLAFGYGTAPGTAGSVSPTTSTFMTGVANAGTTFTAGAGPFVGDQTEAVGATFDNQTISTNVVVHDSTPPTLVSFTADTADPQNSLTVTFTAVFSEPVINFDGGDFGTASGSVNSVTQIAPMDGTTWKVTATANPGSTSMSVNLLSGGIQDTAVPANNLGSGQNVTVTFASASGEFIVDEAGINCLGNGKPIFTDIPSAASAASTGSTIRVCPGTYPQGSSTVSIPSGKNNVTIINAQATKPVVNVSGTSYGFQIGGSGATIEGFEIHKIDNVDKNVITIQGTNFTGQNLDFIADTPWSGGQVSRAFEVSSTGLNINNNTITDFRQPAYINGDGSTNLGTISNNVSSGTKGWVFDNAMVTMTGNTFPAGCAACGFSDIAVFPGASATVQAFWGGTNALAISNTNDNAYLDLQWTGAGDDGRAISYVDDIVTAGNGRTVAAARNSIQDGIDNTLIGGTVHIEPGTFVQEANVNRTVKVEGSGAEGANQSKVSGPIGGTDSATIRITANNVDISGLLITREGNNTTDWNSGLKSAGLAIQGQATTGAVIHDNKFDGNRNALDINNSNGHTIRNNVIDNNRTGMIFRNQTDNLKVVENAITNNWTVGVLFLDASGGTNSPVQTAANSIFSNNNISGNWYGQIVERQAGGSLPAPGTNLKNFQGNWYGSAAPVVTTANSTEPGYSALIPVAYGGTATAPGGQPDIAGPASANFRYDLPLTVGTDTDVETISGRGTYGFQGANLVVNSAVTINDPDPRPAGWFFWNEGPNGSHGLETGPNGSHLGAGSARLSIDVNGRESFGTAAYGGIRLRDITKLKFKTWTTGPDAPVLQFDVDNDLSENTTIPDTTYQGRLVFQPAGTVTPNTWQQWDIFAPGTLVWGSGSGPNRPFSNACPQSNPCTLAALLANNTFKDLGVRLPGGGGTLLFRAGGPSSTDITEFVDDFEVGIQTGNTTYDFEPDLNTAPTVTSITRGGPDPTNAANVTFNVAFSEPVTGVDTTDFALDTAGVSGTSISNVTGSNGNYVVTVNTGSGSGTIRLDVNAGASIFDIANNQFGNAYTGREIYTIDRTGPNSTVSPVADPDTTSPVDFTVSFGETVTGFDAADVTIGGSANPTGFTIDGSYTVHVTGMNQSGTVTVSINNAGVTDSLGNAGTGASSSSAQFNQQTTPNVQTPLAPTWAYYDDNTNAVISGYDYVYGPNGGPLPAGSARLQSGAGDLKGLFTQDYNNTKLANITTLSYSTYVHGSATNEPTLQFNVDYDLTDGNTTYQGRVVYVPSQNGSVSADTWQNWNALTGVFWYSSLSPVAIECTQTVPCTLSQMLAAHPNMGIHATAGAIGFRSEQNSNSNVDNFVIGINSANTVVNFEPAGAMVSTPSSPNGWFYWEDDDDHLVTGYDYVFGPLGGPLPVGSARVASGTTPGDQKKGLFTFQYRGTPLDQLTTLKYSTYAATAGDVPYFQISVDFTGNANPGYQGRLVYVPSENGTFTANTWQTWDMLASTAKFYYSSGTYSPNGDGCLASEGNGGCTLATILSAHPNARVMPNGDPGHPDPNNTWGVIGVRTDPGKSGNVDNIIVGVNAADTTFNFEPAGVVVSTPVSPKGWFSWDDTAEVPCDSEYVTGPAGGPLPVGSAHLSSATCSGSVTSTDRKGFFTKAFQGARLDQITTLKYSSYVPTGTGTPSFQIGVDFTGAANPTYQGRLVYVPTGVSYGSWQTWDLMTPGTKFYYSSNTYSPNGDGCLMNQGSGCTLATILAAHPNARVMPNDDPNPLVPDTWGVLGIRMDANANANVDNVIVGVNGAVNTFDFEAAPPTVSIAVNPGNVTEGSNVSFTVSLTGDTPERTVPVTVLLNTTDGTATGSGTDYTSAVNQVVTFAPGVSSQTVTVATATDNIAEGAETFTATLSNAVNAGIGTASATGTINDGAGYIAIGGHVMAYNNGGPQTGIAGVTMTLTGTSNGSPITLTTPTDVNGNYNFNTGLSTTGQYSVAPTVAAPYVYDPESIYYINPASSVTNANFVGYNNDNPRHVTIGNVTQSQVGANVVVPVTFNALGTEQGGSFVLSFDTSKLQYVSASAPSGTNLVVSAGPGPKTVSFSKLGPPYTGSVTLNFTFSATPGNALSTPVAFANPKRISNTQGVGVPAVWTDGSVIFAQGNEGDISDGTTGGFTDGYVDSPDVSRVVSLIVGDAVPNPNVNEFQRADAGPYLPSRGDGCIDALDLTAILLYSVGDLPTTPAAGPVAPPCGSPLQAKDAANRITGGTVVRFVGSRAAPGSNIDVQVELSAQGIENGTTFTLNYNSTVLDEFPTITLGSGVPNGAFFFTNSMSHPGKTAVTFSLQSGQTMPVGDTVILNFQYHVKSSAAVGTYPVVFTSDLARQRVSNTQAQNVPATWEDGAVEIMLAPTAATSSVGGQVRTADGRGIGNTVVTLTGTDGSVRRALTNQMGFYRIDDVPTGATYVLGATSKRYTFDSRVVTVGDNITDADITPRE